MEKKMPRVTMGLASAALIGGICLGGGQTAMAEPVDGTDADPQPQPQPQQVSDPSSSTTVEQVNDKTTKTTTVTTGTDVTTGKNGATTTTTTETTDTETRTAFDQQRVEDPTLPEGTETVKQQGVDEVSTDRTVKTTETTEQPFQEATYKVLDGRNEAGKDKDKINTAIYRKMTTATHMPQFGGTCINKMTVFEAYRFALLNENNPKDVHYSAWNFFKSYSMTIDDETGTHVLTDDEIKQKDPRFWNEVQKNGGQWTYDADELLAKLKADVLGYDGTTIRALEGEEPTADQVAAILGLDGAGNSAIQTNAMRGMVGADGADDGWHFSADGKSIVRTVVTVETMPTVTVPGQDEIVAYNPAAPATPANPTGPADPAQPAQPAATPAVEQAAAPVAQTAAPAAAAQSATSAAATPQTSDNLGAFAGVVAALPAALGLLAMALLKRRRA